MDILSRFAGKHLDGVPATDKSSKRHLSKSETVWNTIVAKYVDWLWSEPKNKSTMSNPLSQLEVYGIATGTSTGKGASFRPIDYKCFVKHVTKRKRRKKTSRGENHGNQNRNAGVRRAGRRPQHAV